MPNPVTWITNVGKSIGYSMMDQIQEANPTIKSFKEDNTELFKTVKDTIKFRGMRDIGSSLDDNKYFKIAKEGIDNLKDDLRTGKLYNKEREEQSFGKAAARLAGFDDSDFGFDMNGDFGFGDDDIEISDSIEEATMSTNDMMDIVGEKTSKAISSAVIGSSEYIVKSGRRNTQALFKQNNILFSRLHNDMKTINANIGSILDFGKEATTTHYNNSATFFTNMTTKMDETNSLLKELVDIQKEAYGKNEEERHRYGSRYNDIVDSQGLPNFSNIIENIKKNVKNNSTLDMIDMGVDMGLGAQLTGSPGKFISDIIAKSLIPKSIKKAMEGFNESLSSIVPNLLMNIMSGAGDSVVKSFIADLLGLNTGLRTGFSASGYKKDAVPFDGVTRKAITEVIPTYLSKILSAISNSDETRYDYSKGEFVTLDDIRKEFSEITTSYANRTFYNVDTLMKDYAQKIKFDKDNKGDFITKEQFAKNLEEFYEAQYRAGKVFSDRRDGNIDAATYGLSGGKKAEISAKIMTQMWKNLPQRVKMNIADNMNRQREYQNDYISEMEFEGISPNVALFNNSGKNFGVNKDVKRQDAAVAAGKYNSNILSVLVDIRKEVSYIRKYGLSGKNKARRTKGKYEVFDKFDPYKTPDVAIEEYEYGYDIYEDEPLTKRDDEDIEEYTKRSISEYRQINDQIQRANRKKGPFEFLFNLLKKNKNKGRDIDETINRPVQFITSIATKLDNTIYDLLFGREKGNGEEDKGVLQRVGDAIKNTFDNVNIWINENILEPIRENLTKEKFKNATKKFFGFFGIDIEQVGKDVKRFLFGEKDNKGNRTKNGLFGGFVDSLKDSFKDVFGWVKGSAKEVYDESGVKDVVEGKLNESGKTKKKNKKNAKAILRNQKKKAMQKKDDESDEEDNKDNNVDGQAAEGIKTVPRTGIYALSKGEAVIPPDYNHSNIMRRYSNEQRAIDRFKKYGKINMLAEGSDGESTQKEQAVKESKRKLYEEYQERKKAGLEKLANTRLERSDYEELNLKYSVLDEIGKFGKLTKEFFGNAFDKGGNVDKDNLKNNFTEIADNILGDAKNYLPQITAGGILGASASIATGMMVSPLLAGAVGAGVGLVVKSEAVQKLLFGEDITDEDGKTVHKNGLLPENVSNMIQKYAPSMAKGATLGAITSIIPFVPGGTVSGIILGSALGFMNKNEKIHNYLFGEEGKLKGIKDKLKTVLPKMGAGAVLGGLASPIIPGAFVTNMILGSAIGFVTDTEQFKDAFWGEKGKDGKRTGGIYQKVMGSISKPIHKFLKENSEYFTKWFQDTIKRNVKDFFDPLKRRIKDLGTNILNIFKRMGEKFTDTLKLNVFNKLFLFAEKLVKPGSFLYKLGRGFITNTIGLPFNIIGGIGRRMKDSDVRRGKANYMTTANERLEYRKKRRMSSLIWKDKAKKSDEAMNQMSQDDLDLALKSVRGLMNGKDNARHEYINSKNDLSANILRSNLKGRDRKNLVKLLERDDLDGIRGYLDANGIKDEDKAYINTLLNESENKIRNSKYVYDKFKTGEERTKLETELKKFGFDLKKLKPTDLEKYLANELDHRKETNKEAEDKTNKEVVKRWRVDVYDSLKQANETLRNIERLLDPNYTPTKEEQEAVANNPIGKQADKAKEVNYELRTENPTEAEIADEERRMHNANMADSHSREKLRNKLNRQSAKERERNDKDDMRRLDPSIGMSIFARAGIKTKDIFRSIADHRKYMVDELSGYNDDVDDPEIPFILRLSRMVKNEVGSGANRIADYTKDNLNKGNIRNVINSKIQKTMIYEILKNKIETRKNSILNEKNEETEKDSNSTEQTIFDKIKSYIKDKSDKFETSYYNGIAIRNKVDENGNVEADMSDSETVKALKERDEDRNTQKGILSSITSLPSRIGEFFGIGKKKDKEPKENILGKILKWTGMGMLALIVAPKVAEFVKNTVVPVVKETIIPAIIKVGTDFKDGIMEGFFGQSDHEGGLANILGEKIGAGAKWITDFFENTALPWVKDKAIPWIGETIKNIMPDVLRGVEWIFASVVPKAAEIMISNIPALVKGIFKGLGNLGTVITNAIFKKNTASSEDAFGVLGGDKLTGSKSLGSPSGGAGKLDYAPSSSLWGGTGKSYDLGIKNISSSKDTEGNEIKNITASITDETIDSKSKTYDKKGKQKDPKAYTETASNRLNKYKSDINKILDKKVDVDIDGQDRDMSVYDVLNTNEIVGYATSENRDGTQEAIPVRGYELLNYPTLAESIIGINTKLDESEKEEAAKDAGYTHGNDIFSRTSKNPLAAAARSFRTGLLTGNNFGAKFFKNRAKSQLKKAGKSGIIGSIYHGTKAGVYGVLGGASDVGSTLNKSLVKNTPSILQDINKTIDFTKDTIKNAENAKSAAKTINSKAKEVATKKIKNFASTCKDNIVKSFKNNSLVKAVKKLLGKNVDEELEKTGKEIAEKCSKKITEEGTEAAVDIATKAAKKFFIALDLGLAFTEGANKEAGNIAHILQDQVTTPIRILAGLSSVITELVGGFIPSDWIFAALSKLCDWVIPGKDSLHLDELRDEADRVLDQISNEKGHTYTVEDYNKDYSTEFTEYNTAAWKAQELGLTGAEATKYIESNVSKKNTVGQRALEKDKKKISDDQARWDAGFEEAKRNSPLLTKEGYESMVGPRPLATGTPYVPNSGLYALSKGELVIPKLAEGTNPFTLFSNAIGNIKSIFSSSKLEDNIKNIYKYANSGDDKFFKEDALSTDPTSKTINAIAKKLFTPVYAVEKMQNYFVKSLNDELGDGDKVLELFNTQLAETNKYLTGDLSMKNYWNDKLDDNKSMYGNMAKVITNIYKSLQFPMILAKSLFQMQAGRSSNDSGNVDAVSTQNSTANVSTSSISADLSSISTEGTTSTSSSGSTTLSSIKDIMNNIDLTGKIPEGSSGDQYKHLVVKYGEKNVIPFKNRDNKVVGYQIKLKNSRTKYIAVSKNAAVTGYVPGRKPSSVVHNNPNSISGNTAKGSGLFVGAGSEYPPIPIESTANSISDMHYKYSKLPKIRPLSSVDKLDYSTENITSTGDNFVSQVDSNVSNIRFKTNRDTIRQTVATSGCAPAAATMIINSLRGKDVISMNTATKDAIPYKVPNGGVTSKYFDDEFDKYGIGTDYLENNSNDPNKNYIIRAIRERRPTILLGQDSSNKNKSNSPFGPNPHYVVADSISKDGKYIFINDPESKKPRTKYLLKSILPNIRVGISTFLGKGGRKLGKLYIGSAKSQVKAPAGDYIGKNTKRFESGDKGPRATGSCGNDGGGSYGSYQMIYSGSAKSFWAEHFAAKYGSPSSPSDLNSKWLKAVDEIGESAFFAKEWGYILDNYYKPAVAGIKKAGFDPDNYSRAMQDCIWSWAVHRGASGCINEFKYVMAEIKDPMNADETTLINKCYDVRGQKMTGQWSSIATGRYGTGSDSERVVMLSLVGQPPIDYTAPDGVLFAGSKAGTDLSAFTENNTGDGEYKSILDILFAPFDMLAASHKLTGSNNGNTTSVGTTEYNADGISGPVSADPAIAQKQVQVVAKMKSVYGKLKYAQDNAKYPGSRNPDDGSGDCSSTVQWAYDRTLGVDVGSWSGGQADSSNTYLVDGGHSVGGKTDESKLQLGDIMIYGPDNHAEMYFGHGKVLTHGNPNALGPVVADVNRRDDYWGTKRLNQFRSTGTANYDSSASSTFNTGQTAHNSQTSMSGYTASGSGLVGRGSFVSQLDPRYANRRFNRKGDTINQTIGDSGCAPAAATMVLNDIAGRASMLDSSRLALQYKDTNDGVSADYFGDIYSRHGLNANYYNRKEQVTSDLYGGKDVVLLGSDRKNRSKSNSPFGPNPHYVVASGISKDGRSITIKDPEGKRPKKYSTNKILNNTKLGIGYGSGLLNKVLKNYKGRGFGAFSGILYVGDSRFDGMKDCVSESGVYFIAKVSMGLKWLRTTARSQISAKVKSDPNLAVVFNLGVNDLYNKNNYINTYKEIKAAHPNVKFFFMSVNPVDHDPYATDAEVVQFNNTMKEYWGSDYLDIYSYLKSDGYKTVDGIHYDNATSKKIHNKCKEMISGLAPTGSTSTTGSAVDTSEDSILDRILGSMDNLAVKYGLMRKVGRSMDNLAVKYGLMRKVGNSGSETAGTTTISGPGSEFPKYTLSDSAINDIATGVTGETGGDSMFTSMQEASQMANLNEVTRKRSANESGIITTIHDGWYSPNSWTRGVTNTAKEAVKKVFVEGKRTLPRYVTEHDTFPLDIKNAKNRSEYKFGDPVSNRYGSNYKFYDFFGENKDGDISGYFQSDYEKYKNDQPWSGSGSGLVNMPKYKYKQKYSGRSSRLNNISDVFDTFTNAIESSASINANNSNSGTISNNDKDLVAMMKTIIKLLAKVADNTNDISDIISILSKLVDLQSTVEKTGEIKSNINDLKRQLTSKLNSHNKANIGSGDLYNLMNNIESLATE